MKKSVIIIPLLLIATIVTIITGQRYSAKQREEMDESQFTSEEVVESPIDKDEDSGDSDDEKDENAEKNLEYYEENSTALSLYEYLDFLSLKNEEVSIAYYGDIDLEEEWINEINTELSNAVSGEIAILNHTYPGSDSYDLYIQQTAQAVITDDPDVIIYGMSALPDKIRDMGLTETDEFMGYILDSLLSLEDSKVLLLEPYPVPGEMNQLNSRSLDYRSYLNRMQTISADHDLTVLSLHEKFLDQITEESIASYFNEDDTLNEEGTSQVVSIMDLLFKE